MALIPSALSPLANGIDRIFPDKWMIRLQETLIRSGMYVKASDLITLLVCVGLLMGCVLTVAFLALGQNPIIAFIGGLIAPSGFIFAYIFFMMERRIDAIEQGTPDFLRQISSLLRSGIGVETAMEDISKHGEGPLTDELKRAVIEIKIGSTFEDALLGMSERLKSKTLDRTFRMIIEGRRVGGSLADVIETVAEDLRAVLALQRERRANVMMSVMFLLIAAVIAAPFALGMIMAYSGFIETAGKPNPLAGAAETSAFGYIVIHSIIAGILMGIVLYGSPRKGVKFSLMLAPAATGIFWLMGLVAPMILGI